MGALYFIIYNNNNTNINLDFIDSFINIKSRGVDDSEFQTVSMTNLTTLNTHEMSQVYSVLSKNEIMTYIPYIFLYGYHRLAINDTCYNASQPFQDPIQYKIRMYPELRSRPIRKLMCNGEIYNYNLLKSSNEFTDRDLASECDVEIIMPMYIKNLTDSDSNSKTSFINTLNELCGEFAIILSENTNTFDIEAVNIFAARDLLGIKPLYYIYGPDNFYMFVSELKGIPINIIKNTSYNIIQVPPGSVWSFQENKNSTVPVFTEWMTLSSNITITQTDPDTMNEIYNSIYTLLKKSIIDRYTTSQSMGILLSGGINSCIVASILVEHVMNTSNWETNPIIFFTIGDTFTSPDVEYSNEFVQFLEDKYSIDIEYHTILLEDYSIQQIDIDNIIYRLETYDNKTIRDSIPYYYLFKYISEHTSVKVIFTGDGLNSLCGSSKFHDLDDATFQEMSVNLLKNIGNYEMLRNDRISGTFSLETRQPYLDIPFINYMLSLHPKLKKAITHKIDSPPIEKYIIRKSIQVNNSNLLPDNILWRNINPLSNNFNMNLYKFFDKSITDIELSLTNYKSKEHMYYSKVFNKHFPNRSYIIENYWDDL